MASSTSPPSDALLNPPDASTPECHLVELPAELRNRIYRLVLLQDPVPGIQILVTGHERSGLVSVCKQIRRETIKIFYYENKFVVDTPQWSPKALLSFYRQLRQLNLTENREYTQADGFITLAQNNEGVSLYASSPSDFTPHWANALEEVRLIHTGEIPEPLTGPEAYLRNSSLSRLDKVLLIHSAMASMAYEMRAQPWSLVEKVLSHQRAVLGDIDRRWLRDDMDVDEANEDEGDEDDSNEDDSDEDDSDEDEADEDEADEDEADTDEAGGDNSDEGEADEDEEKTNDADAYEVDEDDKNA